MKALLSILFIILLSTSFGQVEKFLTVMVNATGGGTVTSIGTNNLTGLIGGTITGSGTIYIDTLIISTRGWRNKLADSLGVLIATKQALGNYITDLTGDVSASGPGSAMATLATVNGNVGSFTNVNITVNAKGLITSASNGGASGTVTSVSSPLSSINIATGTTTPAIDVNLGHNNYFTTNQSASVFGVGTGSTTPVSILQTVETSASATRGIIADQYSTNTNSSRITMRKARGTFGSPSVITTGDLLGRWGVQGHDGTNFVDAGAINITSTGAISTNVIPSIMNFQTSNSSGTLTTGFSMDAAQLISLPAYTSNGVVITSGGVGLLGIKATTGTVNVVLSTSPTISTPTLGANTASNPAIQFTPSGAVLPTSPTGGALSVDANGISYYTHATSERGVIDAEQFISNTSTYTLVSQTGLQQLFNVTTNGAVTVSGSKSYFFECQFDLSSMSATSGTFQFGFGGTATLTSVKYTSNAAKNTLTSPASGLIATISSAVATNITSNNTTTVGHAFIKGIIRVNAGGTLIPSVGLTTAAAAVVGVNAWFRMIPVGTNTIQSVGNWN